jgi:membrane fusion protein, multidrug efflux system
MTAFKPIHRPNPPAAPPPPIWPALALALGLLSLAAGCGKSHSPSRPALPDPPTAQVQLQQINPQPVPIIELVLGTVQSRHSAELEAKIAGRIVTLPVVLGQPVKQGDLLATLDAQEIQARSDQTETALRQAEIDHRRISQLRQTGAATPAEADAATHRLQSAQAALAEAAATLAHTRITAPISGVVARKDADVGDLALPGRPLLRLDDPDQLRFEATVPESALSHVTPHTRLKVHFDSLDQPLEADVAEIAPNADPTTRSVRVRLNLPPANGLRPGQFGRLAVPFDSAELLLVPTRAIVHRGQLDLVFVAHNNRAQMRIVRTGRTIADSTEILAGLHPGESIVVDNAAMLIDGQPLLAR